MTSVVGITAKNKNLGRRDQRDVEESARKAPCQLERGRIFGESAACRVSSQSGKKLNPNGRGRQLSGANSIPYLSDSSLDALLQAARQEIPDGGFSERVTGVLPLGR
jgi:hypothetical protein